MQISFFEEFPTKKNLAKIRYVPFPTKLYLAAHSLKEFESIKVPSIVKEKIYWPILKREEGYWFSPFSKREAMQRIMEEVKTKDIPILWDAELPTHTNSSLYITECLNFQRNKDLIHFFIAQRKKIYTAEYFPSSKLAEKILFSLGLSFKTKHHFPIKMIYSSMHDFGEDFMRKEIGSAKQLYGKKLCIGLGTLTHGIRGDEPSISSKILERDLRICKKAKVEEVIIFRLGGMTKEYAQILQQFL